MKSYKMTMIFTLKLGEKNELLNCVIHTKSIYHNASAVPVCFTLSNKAHKSAVDHNKKLLY
jgi:hypothetical protein